MKRALAILLLASSAPLAAGQDVRADGYVVHYAAINAGDLAPEIAARLHVTRGHGRCVLIVNVQRAAGGVATQPVRATATGVAHSLNGSDDPLALRPAGEGEDLLAEFEVIDREYVTFDLAVTPQGATRPIAVRFTQQFFAD